MRWLGRGVYRCCDYFWVSFAGIFFRWGWVVLDFFGGGFLYLGGGAWGWIIVLN